MNPKQKLESILTSKYESEDGDLYKVELLDGMTNEEITEYKNSYLTIFFRQKLKNF